MEEVPEGNAVELKTLDVSVDLETMSTHKNAAIMAIGAALFDQSTGEIKTTFYRVVDFDTAIKTGGHVSGSTLNWWLQQSEEARKALYEVRGDDIRSVLEDFLLWLEACAESTGNAGDDYPLRLWGNGADFDNAILAGAYERLGWRTPWSYQANRCYRTFLRQHQDIERPESLKEGLVAHNALSDAIYQAKVLMHITQTTGRPLA